MVKSFLRYTCKEQFALIIIFADFEKAYDIKREKLWKILVLQELSPKGINSRTITQFEISRARIRYIDATYVQLFPQRIQKIMKNVKTSSND